MASKFYTNADLKPEGGPTTTYGPWRTKPGVRSSMQSLFGEGESQDEILAGAKEALARTAPTPGVRGGSIRPASMGERLSSMAKEYTPDVISKLLWPVAKAASLPASLAGGGIGVAGSLPMAIEALSDFAGDPSVMGAAGAGLMLAPGVSALRGGARAAQAARAAGEAEGVASGLFRGTGLRRAKEVPYKSIGSLDDYTPFDVVDDVAPVPQSSDVSNDLLAQIRASISGLPNKKPTVVRAPMGQGSRPSTREFASELESINSLGEQDIAELLDAIAWSRR